MFGTGRNARDGIHGSCRRRDSSSLEGLVLRTVRVLAWRSKIYRHPLSSEPCGAVVRSFAVCTSRFRTLRRGRPRLAGANCPSSREYKFVGTYPFCILVRLGAAVDSSRSLPSEVQNR